jgi:putative acetyltransferase
VVLGHPSYYPRFGFLPSVSFNLRSVYDAPPEAFMVRELREGSLRGRSGLVHYRPEFGGA